MFFIGTQVVDGAKATATSTEARCQERNEEAKEENRKTESQNVQETEHGQWRQRRNAPERLTDQRDKVLREEEKEKKERVEEKRKRKEKKRKEKEKSRGKRKRKEKEKREGKK
jgi:DNA-directed RNA polymerase III subunit RPC6